MARLADVVAHFDDQLKVPPALFKVLVISDLVFHYFNLLLYVDQVPVHSIDFLFPFKWVNTGL